MDQSSYDWTKLGKKYDDFSTPGFEVSVGGKELTGQKYHIPFLEVELTADGTAGGCTFALENQFDYDKSKWDNGASDTIKAGAKLVVKGGYVQKKEIFYGYVDDYSLDFQAEGCPRITVTGIDGLGYLMSLREPIYAGKKKPTEIVKSILNKSVSAGFAKKVTVGSLSGFETPLVKEEIDDWKFLNLLSQRFGMSLFVVDGEIIFDDVLGSSSPIMTLTLGQGLFSFRKRVSLAHQVGKVEVWGRDVNQKAVKGTASSVTAGGSGKSAAQLVSALKDAALREYSEFARTQEECKTLAQRRLNGVAMGLVSGGGECIGMPELIPGRYIEIEGGDKQANGTYFLSKVKHQFTEDGYRTSFEIKGAKA
jgi:phage protein D